MVHNLTPSVGEIIVNLQCGFRRHQSKTDHKFCTREIVENEMWQSREDSQTFTYFKKDCGSVEGSVLFNILFSFVLP